CNNEQVEESTEPQEQTDTEEPTTFEGENEEAPIVTMEMENDQKVIIELYPQVAPNTVDNFISLVQDGFYDGFIFHRVIPGFIIHEDSPHLDGDYAGFGQVIEGMDVIDDIAEVPTNNQDRPEKEQKIKSMTVELDGYEFNEPEKIEN